MLTQLIEWPEEPAVGTVAHLGQGSLGLRSRLAQFARFGVRVVGCQLEKFLDVLNQKGSIESYERKNLSVVEDVMIDEDVVEGEVDELKRLVKDLRIENRKLKEEINRMKSKTV